MSTALRVTLIGSSAFVAPEHVRFDHGHPDGQALIEFAGRSIYRSFDRPRPDTADTGDFLEHLISVGHLAALEHASATLYVQHVSQAAAGELLRHRHLSISQLSPRTPVRDVVEPPEIVADPALHQRFREAIDALAGAHDELFAALGGEADRATGPTRGAQTADLAHKQARQAAAALLPRSSATDLVVTANHRAWRHVIAVRATDAADREIRAVAVAVLEVLTELAPHLYGDFRISTLPDGSRTAASPFTGNA